MLVESSDQEAVAKAVKAAVEARGAVVTSWTESETEFEGLKAADGAFTRAGYIGTYQYHGETDVELRVRLFALTPERVFWATVILELLVIVAFLVAIPPPNLWVASALVMALVLGAVYWARRDSTRLSVELEREFSDYLAEELTAEGGPAEIVVRQEQLEELEEIDAIERELRMEEAKRAVGATKRERRPPPRPAKRADAEDLDSKRKRLLALKAELAKRKEREEGGSSSATPSSEAAKP